MANYKMIPVDNETHVMLTELIAAYEMPLRSYGAIVKKLAKAEYEKLGVVKLLPSQQRKIDKRSTGPLAEA